MYIDGWHAIPTIDCFSRHNGTCLVVGDKTYQSQPYTLKLGDCLRLGSVGLVVSEMKCANGSEERLNPRTLQYLRDEVATMGEQEEDAALAAEELFGRGDSPNTKAEMFRRSYQVIIYFYKPNTFFFFF